MYRVKWGVFVWDEETGKPVRIKKWYKKDFELRGVEEETVRFEAFLFFRKKSEDPRYDKVVLEAFLDSAAGIIDA